MRLFLLDMKTLYSIQVFKKTFDQAFGMNIGYSKAYIVSHLNESSQSFIFYFQLKFPIFCANYISVVFVKDFPGKHRVSGASFCDKIDLS